MMADPGSMAANMRQFGPGPGDNMADTEAAKMRQHHQDLENLRNMLIAWNANRLDLFELSMPNEVGRQARIASFSRVIESSDKVSNIGGNSELYRHCVFHFLLQQQRLQAKRDVVWSGLVHTFNKYINYNFYLAMALLQAMVRLHGLLIKCGGSITRWRRLGSWAA